MPSLKGPGSLVFRRNDDFNGAVQEGAGYFQLTSRNGRRCSSAVAYLNPARGRPNLEIVTHAHTERLLFDGNEERAVAGVAYNIKGQPRQARVKPGGEVVLSAGAIGSPQVLQISGIGPGALLQAHEIPVRQDLAGVGENLQDHLQIRMIYEVNVPTLNDEINNPLRRMMIGMRYVLFRKGSMAMGASQVCIFAKTRAEIETPRHPVPLPALERGQARYRDASLLRHHRVGLPAAPGKPRQHQDQVAQARELPLDPAQLPLDGSGSGNRSGGHTHVPSLVEDQGLFPLRGRRACARPRRRKR